MAHTGRAKRLSAMNRFELPVGATLLGSLIGDRQLLALPGGTIMSEDQNQPLRFRYNCATFRAQLGNFFYCSAQAYFNIVKATGAAHRKYPAFQQTSRIRRGQIFLCDSSSSLALQEEEPRSGN